MTPSSLAIHLREKPPQRILIIKPSAIGDVVHTLPILNLLRRQWPAAKISWLVTPTCSSLIEGHPQLDEVILFDRKAFGTGWRRPSSIWPWTRRRSSRGSRSPSTAGTLRHNGGGPA